LRGIITETGRRTIWVTLFPVGDRLVMIADIFMLMYYFKAYICQDITRQKEMEHQLKRYSEDLENLVKERTAELEAALEVKVSDFEFDIVTC
jgi:C4-dicarboxylate-specific signal transduction histidine kinase